MGVPLFAQSPPGITSAEDLRLLNAALWTPAVGSGGAYRWSGRSGVRPGPTIGDLGPLQVRALTPTTAWAVRVGNGVAVVESTTATTKGVYLAVVPDVITTLAISPPDPSHPRIDVVVVHVYDNAVEGDETDPSEWVVEVVPGTPATTPVPPTLPMNSIALAAVRVNTSDTSVTDARITDMRTWTVPAGATLPVISDTDMPLYPYQGQKVYRLDWAEEWVYIGGTTGWRALGTRQYPISGTQSNVASTSTVATVTVPVSPARVGQYMVLNGNFESSNNTTATPNTEGQIDGTPMSGAGRFNRGTSTLAMIVPMLCYAQVTSTGTKSVTAHVGGGAAGSWTFEGIVVVG